MRVKVQGKEQVLGQVVRDRDGHRLGRVVGVRCAPDPYTVAWFLVGRAGRRHRVRAVPATAARWDQLGSLAVPFSRDQVLHSPLPVGADDPAGGNVVSYEVEAYYAAVDGQ